MDLHRLTLRAIGPYAREHTVDFAALGQSGLFLLEGPTGSGKSTIIDALVFALYGSLASESSSVDRLHSHHADPATEPFVELVFETSAGIHRVRRTPQWWRPKARGTGVTRANASATLTRLATPDASAGEVLSTSAQEVGGEIARIVGLTRQQFVQTVVLPQGEFARFLASSGEDRRLVLQSLFGTEVYERTTARLVDLRREANASVSAADHAVDLALARVREAAGDEEVEAAAVPALVAAFEPVVDEARRSRDVASAAAVANRALVTAQRSLRDALASRSALLLRRDALAARADEAAHDRARLDLGRRAAAVAGPLAAHRTALTALRAAEEAWAVAAAAPSVSGADADADAADAADVAPDALRSARDGIVSELASLAGAAAVEAALPGRRAALVRDATRLDEVDERIVVAAEALAARPAEREPLAARAVATAEAVRDVADAERGLELAEAARAAVSRAAELAAAADAAARERDRAAARAAQAVDVEAGLRRRRIAGMAGELARGLGEGEACPVCGSREHPALAVLTAEHPDDEAVETAATRRADAEASLAEAATAAATASARHAAAAEALDGLDAAQAEARVAQARDSVATSTATAAAASAAADALAGFDADTERFRRDLEAMRVARAGEASTLEASRVEIERNEREVADALDSRASTVADLVERLRERRGALEGLLTAADALEAARTRETERLEALSAAVAESGFRTADDAEGAVLDRKALDGLAESVGRDERDRAVVEAGLADDRIAGLTGDESVDVDGAEAAASAAEALLAEAQEAFARVDDRLRRTRSAASGLADAIAAGASVAEEARAVVRMADVASASGSANTRGVTLGTYVLLRRFEDVVAAANVRLAVMSSGRYRLEASEARETSSRARKTGLALAIRDDTTDTTRDPKSFSGGETFYASLSLALGLADVVQAEAGGLDLGTLFVDEGFGTLDPETLDAVMSELGRLSEHGRVVGIVSHVEELKQRIADRIEVRRLPDGSSTLSTTV
ncbi:Nuclease SbcCD subunit C [Frondihabitans sp. 762G35]|uniref:AAA family ATPase n=1 Tax=Frondihabitans sp. 762G35 TaxID=1446794 RepID=UPI000D20E0DE|nr:SMC family ATPase [Frondihabitans sp. 762G35]ARC58120.1 Nuclease SbcCD subunit C [Frondihabitans sp. 762G35]